VKESSGAQTVDQDSGIVRNVWEWIPIFRVGGGGGYLWRFGMGFLCGRSRRCGAVQRVVEFLLARQSLACECEDVPTVVSSEIDCYVEIEREWSGRHNSRAWQARKRGERLVLFLQHLRAIESLAIRLLTSQTAVYKTTSKQRRK
jgi:hypothetical protein